jgi:uncharacterized protein involved in response to NO
VSTAAARRAYSGPALFSYGFRPFFLLGAAWAAISVPLWVWSYLAGSPIPAHRDWHIHEMLFGFMGAVIAGFLTTAVPNWTGRMPVVGAPLAGLVALWVAGRLAMVAQFYIGVWAAVVDCAFLIVFAAVIWREVFAGGNWKNAPVCLLVSLLALANLGFHFNAALGSSDIGQRLAVAAGLVLIALIGGRIVPSFTRNWLMARGAVKLPAAFGLIDKLAMALTVVGAGAWVAAPFEPFAGGLLVLAGLANLVRLVRWRGWQAHQEPLVWILHLGYGWLAAGQLLLGASLFVPSVPYSAGVHAVTAGAIGVMTLAVMTRASRGHTGHPLAADRVTTAIYLCALGAAAFRVAAPFDPGLMPVLMAVSAALWVLAFGGFALGYGPLLLRPRRTTA